MKGLSIKLGIKNGTNFTALAGQRGATLNRSGDTIDVSNKVTGDWKEFIAGAKEWSVDCDGIVMKDDTSFTDLEAKFNAGDVIDVQFSNDGKDWGYEGKAIIVDFPIDTPYDDAVTYTVSLQGTGALTPVKAAMSVK